MRAGFESTLTTSGRVCSNCRVLPATCSSKFVLLDWVGLLVLCPAEVRRIPAGISGVYLIHAFVPVAGGYPVVYAGRSRDLRQRLLRHGCGRSAKPIIRAIRRAEPLYWSAAPLADASLRARSEAGLIRLLEPSCNIQTPSAEPVVVNLPPMLISDPERRF